MQPAVDGAMAAALEQHRDRFNRIVAEARRGYPDFDTGTLEQLLRGSLRELVDSCERAAPGSGPRILAAIFDAAVALVGQHRLAGGSHDPLVAALPALARILLDEPRRVFAALANAVFHLHAFGLPVAAWVDRVTSAATSGDAARTLRVGQLAAWLVGLAHYRDSALDVAATLDEAALGAALGVPTGSIDTLRQLRENRWWRPDRTPTGEWSVAHRVGGFRGFGGPFLALPRVATRDGQLIVSSGADAWLLHADAWGATLTRTEPTGFEFRSPDPRSVSVGLRPVSIATIPDVTALTVVDSYRVLVMEPGR